MEFSEAELQEFETLFKIKYDIDDIIKKIDISQLRPGPEYVLDAARVEAFDRLYETLVRDKGCAKFLAYEFDFPKWQFLDYLVNTKPLLLHGTTDTEITEFVPRLAGDVDKRQEPAVYAASEPMTPLYFAILNRKSFLKYSAVNCLCRTLVESSGKLRRYYLHSIDYRELSRTPWCNGAVYILPRITFQCDHDQVQWMSPVSARPLARLAVTAQDFPLMNQIYGCATLPLLRRTTTSFDGYPWTYDPDVYPIRPV